MNTAPITSIRLTWVRIPLREPFAISGGCVREKDSILVELFGDGQRGLGEASPMAGAFYDHHTPESCWDTLTRVLVPAIQRRGELDLDGRWAADFTADSFATCGIDTACWDLAARRIGQPLYAVLGGNGERAIHAGLAVGIQATTGALLECIEHHLAAGGYGRVKLKVQPGWDVEPLTAFRGHFGDLPLMVDANCAYGRADITHLAAWDRFGLQMIEQPLPRDDLEGHALLAASSRTPICLDESATSPETVARAIELGAASIVNIKLQRVGSFAAARQIHDLAAAAGVGCWMGTMPELGVGAHAAMHFCTLPNVVHHTDVEASERWFVDDVSDPQVRCTAGLLEFPSGSGLGIGLRDEVVAKHRLRTATYTAAIRLDPTTPRIGSTS